ncbi:class I SAM-dependent methyltransferase [Bauldia sp.]|uniref:class I SAM-dependent methyltransferase n=1 Tax=Bauldia sp. TaxID=2575872 RepID=UPI0025C62DC8|nr:class I SAM-dependent methyltransferase [Bauldia sp.]
MTASTAKRSELDSDAPVRAGRPAMRAPVMLETAGWEDYALLDSGHGRKLERFGRYRVVRPEEQALWTPRMAASAWESADATFVGIGDDEADGRWRMAKPIGETWPMRYDGIGFLGRFTSFRHVGVFPEQATHWAWLAARIAGAGKPAKVLNLFGYTGLASLVAARAGAEVVHIDASKKAIGWARENQAVAGLPDLPIRWICEDAVKFVAREERRGNRYDGIILDPPKFGRGPKGEVWDIFAALPDLLRACARLLTDDPAFLILTAYSIRSSFLSMHELTAECLEGRDGVVESGELVIREEGGGRGLSTSLFSRWSPDG